ncbi:MAG: zinc ABC transporter substrate-binding protein [Candidatus Krumholzibacteria bacterium]|nr:zinc ABC transporter substrate-binding protein [Candidatus Krumholzibacteria bacterium]
MKQFKIAALFIFLLLVVHMGAYASEKIKVVTTFSDFASITKEIAGDLADVEYLSYGDQDPHFVPPKPSLALKLKDADMLVSTGFDMELWLATLQDKARNRKIMDGAVGYITVSPGIEALQKPKTLSRAEGHVHIMGNPHFHTSPLNWRQISENILIGLKRVDHGNASTYEANQNAFVDRMYRAMFGDALVEMFGGDQLADLLRAGTLFEFLDREYQGEKLVARLGGWVEEAMPFRGMEVIAYHKNWAYFARDFGLTVVGYIEPKPGIPPTPKHVEQTIRLIKDRKVDMMLVATHFEKRKPMTISQKTGIKVLFLPLSVGAVPEVPDCFSLVDYWIDQINEAVKNRRNVSHD